MKISAFLSLPYRLLAGLRLGEPRGVMRIENHTPIEKIDTLILGRFLTLLEPLRHALGDGALRAGKAEW